MAKRVVLIGAGSAQFGFGTLGDIFQSKVLAGSEIVLHDINPQALDRVLGFAQLFVREKRLPFQVTGTTVRAEAVKDADFCIISIEVGDRFALWEQDWRVAQQYGIRQVYGENGGPGGLFHSLRIIPPILEICGDIERLAPGATVFNYSNPMSRICTTVKRKYPGLRLVGMCHEIASIPTHLPRMLQTPVENLQFRAGGLNHFSVLLEVRYRDSGKDAYPDVRAKAPEYFRRVPEIRDLAEWRERVRAGSPNEPLPSPRREWSERRLFLEILERFGYMPITTDSHFGEYISWAHGAADHQGILDFFTWYKSYCLRRREPEIRMQGFDERVVPIVEGILTDSGYEEAAVNLPNQGLIRNLPEEIVVEVPAVVGKDGLHGVSLGRLPAGFAGLLQNQVAVHELTAQAVLEKSRALALQALLVDPVVHSHRAAERTLATMVELQPDHLGYLL
jgi:alpha-galactosidase